MYIVIFRVLMLSIQQYESMRANPMSSFYTLHTNAALSVAEIEYLLDIEHISHDVLNLGVHPHSERTATIMSETCRFRPTSRVIYHLARGNYDQSVRTMITTVVKLLMADASDLALLYQVDTVLLQRLQSSLILNDTGFWRPEYRALVTLPHTMEKLPDLP
jgi:hypothetical protein